MAAFVTACGPAAATLSGTPAVGAQPGDVAPQVSGQSLAGRHVALSALRGSVVVVVFWASWCGPCQAEQPAVNALAAREAGSGVRFVGVSVDVDPGAARGYVSKYSVPYDSVVDTTQAIAVAYDVAGPPTTFVVDARGRVADELVGELNTDHLAALITAAEGNG